MSGDVVVLSGAAMDAFVVSLGRLAPMNPVVIGGLAVMSRVGGEHRPTLDIDSAFNNESETDTTALLVASGVATKADAPQRVVVDGAMVDVIDTAPIDAADLPDDEAPRLFVCAHRFAFETATEVDFIGDTNRATVRVATPEALVAMKVHALRFGAKQRRMTKRSSDLYDLVRLTTAGDGQLLSDAPWGLRAQVCGALVADLGLPKDRSAAAAVLRGSPVPTINAITLELLDLVLDRLTARLA